VALLLKESGGHRWQRIPPANPKGQVHTSTVTVAVFELKPQAQFVLRDEDIEIQTTMDSGPGGQHRNKTESCVVMIHKPTGLSAKSAEKSQHYNRRKAREILEERVAAFTANKAAMAEASNRKAQVGSGMRGDKIRTYRVRDDIVTDHRTGKKARLQDVMNGRLEKLA
jgi:peptide chain release factor 1